MHPVLSWGWWMNFWRNSWVIIYLDEIFIFSKTKEESLEHIKQVFQRLREEYWLINLKKCTSMKDDLGFVILDNVLKMDIEKVKVILD